MLLTLSVGCWEQWSDDWFPQMKRQKAVQAFETAADQVEGMPANFSPPEGTMPVSGGYFPVENDAQANALINPRPMSLESLSNGEEQYQRFCATCHGEAGMGDGPVSFLGDIRGPFLGVLPVKGGVVNVRSDGHLYITITDGRRRMPSYQRIASNDRWDIVNYMRYLNGKRIGQ